MLVRVTGTGVVVGLALVLLLGERLGELEAPLSPFIHEVLSNNGLLLSVLFCIKLKLFSLID